MTTPPVDQLVSRDTHGVIDSDDRGAVYTDRSRRGTFLDGKRLRAPLRITQSVTLRLGDPATGEELGITPPLRRAAAQPGPAAAAGPPAARRGRGRGPGGGGGTVAAILAVAGSPAPAAAQRASTAAAPSPAVLRQAEAATVRLLQGSPSSYTGWGSGTIVGPDGLILTNAHVAEPQANPPYLTVELTTGPASPVSARYWARPVAVDGYLDLAVVQVYATSTGTPVDPRTLHLPSLPLGRDGAVQLDQPVTVPDPRKHVADPRFELETTARLAHGNSGGAAVSDTGQLIGIPSLEVSGPDGDQSWRLRAVTEARALITAGGQAMAPGQAAVFGADFTGAPRGLDLALLVALPDGSAVTVPTGGLPQLGVTRASGCFTVQLSAGPAGADRLARRELPRAALWRAQPGADRAGRGRLAEPGRVNRVLHPIENALMLEVGNDRGAK